MKHRWSGWPGAWCLDCGQEDKRELEDAGFSKEQLDELTHLTEECPEPNSDRHNPYKPKVKL